jgi:hypothetical protein
MVKRKVCRNPKRRKKYAGAWRVGGPVHRLLSALGLRSSKRRRR